MPSNHLKPEEKVSVAVGMVDCVTQICIDSIREEKPRISDAKLIRILRRRFRAGRFIPRPPPNLSEK